MPRLHRRGFLKSAALGAASFTILGTRASGKIRGANDDIRIAVVGLNGRGGSHVDAFTGIKGVRVAYLVDADSRTFQSKLDFCAARGHSPKTTQDIRTALDSGEVDAISIATPNHWHSLMTIWGCQAGKDVYVEKPLSHNVHEGKIALETARHHNRIVQHGTQNRSDPGWARVMAVIHSGQLGKLKVARALCYKRRNSIGNQPNSPAPAEVDFNLWLGPAPEQPHHANLVHYNWHWFWDFGNGDIGNQGVHQMDVARWGIKDGTLPTSVYSLGGRFGYKDQGETANTQISVMEFGETQLVFEVRGLPTDKLRGQDVGNIFELEAGVIAGHAFYPDGGSAEAPLPEVEYSRGPGDGPFANFIEAVRSRKVEDLNADVMEAHYSSALCHLANVSYRLGQETSFDGATSLTANNPVLGETMDRMVAHLRNQNVPIEGGSFRSGKALRFDPTTERFVGDDMANAYLTRNYRAPFTVPEKVS